VLDELVFFSEEDNEAKLTKTRLNAGDLVLVRSGQPGTAAVSPPELDGVNAIDLLIATPSKGKCDSSFVCAFFNSRGGHAIVLASQRGQIQRHLNVGSLSEALIPLPPFEMQREYSRRLHAATCHIALQSDALAELDALFASLQHRAFRGEL
jgi:type I restriction enzyme S subunit